jgi:beta-lactamase regulating signal transducer with metallopeptidase domain
MIGLSGFVQAFAGRVLNSIPEGIFIALSAWIILRMAGRQNSGTRFAVWFITFLAIALLPFIPATGVGGTVTRTVDAEVMLPGGWAVFIFILWIFVALFASARIIFGLLRLRSIRNNASLLSADDLTPELGKILQECRTIRAVEIKVSSKVRVPTAIGFFHPVILLPDWTIGALSQEELRAVVLHEFAHLRRRDDWTNLAQKLVRAVFFFHPAVLWIEKRLSLEREMACDDAVLAETGNPHVYARCLVSLAEKSFVRRSVALAQAAISRAHETSLRVARILDLDRPRATKVFKPAMAAVGAVVAFAIVVIPSAPRLVAFRNTPASSRPITAAQLSSVDEYPQVAKSMVIPAAARLEQPQRKALNLLASKDSRVSNAEPARAFFASHNSSTRRPVAVVAGLKQNPQEVLVVTETTNYFQHGSELVGISVWRVTLVKAVGKASKQIERPKQT